MATQSRDPYCPLGRPDAWVQRALVPPGAAELQSTQVALATVGYVCWRQGVKAGTAQQPQPHSPGKHAHSRAAPQLVYAQPSSMSLAFSDLSDHPGLTKTSMGYTASLAEEAVATVLPHKPLRQPHRTLPVAAVQQHEAVHGRADWQAHMAAAPAEPPAGPRQRCRLPRRPGPMHTRI